MTKHRWPAWCAVAVSASVITTSGFKFARAAGLRTNADEQHARARALVVDIRSLRASRELTALGPRPNADMLDAVSATLASANMPATVLQNLTSEPESFAGIHAGSRYFRQRARVHLVDMTLPDLGRWLQEWRQVATGWTISSIEIRPDKPTATLQHTDIPRLRATILIETLYVTTGEETESR